MGRELEELEEVPAGNILEVRDGRERWRSGQDRWANGGQTETESEAGLDTSPAGGANGCCVHLKLSRLVFFTTFLPFMVTRRVHNGVPGQCSEGVLAPPPAIRTPSLFRLHWGWNQEPSAPPPRSQQAELAPPLEVA
ncbi:hypothetical protein D4764_02G0000980 [Takifugu flavidus]|uniref:Uncharacterized protein n=1 Tax=Takifugu flavidus TaxID=433684 RepID=A0A5C6NN30_9TELE|nr:hypothetical protein D4764_02G0000980 [Takifugu flavidus]